MIVKKIKKFLQNFSLTKNTYYFFAWHKGRLNCYLNLYSEIKKYKSNNDKPVFLLFTPEHNNLGDHAIAYAEKKILNELKISYHEVTNKQLEFLDYFNFMSVFDGALILITGGGNLGSLWTWIENINRQIIMSNPNSRIIVFPNTIYYGDSKEDQEYLAQSKQIYNSHKQLYLYAREKFSYDFMREAYNNVKLIPDMVLSLKYSVNMPRSYCVLCLRNDNEVLLTKNQISDIKNIVFNIFDCDKVICSNTLINYAVSVANRRSELIRKLNIFSSAKLVITDRLHGMIFAAITGTNCIVLDSKSPKLRGCFEWIKHLDYIRFIDDISEIECAYRSMPLFQNKYDNEQMLPLFQELKNDIKFHYNEFFTL